MILTNCGINSGCHGSQITPETVVYMLKRVSEKQCLLGESAAAIRLGCSFFLFAEWWLAASFIFIYSGFQPPGTNADIIGPDTNLGTLVLLMKCGVYYYYYCLYVRLGCNLT